MAYIGNQTTSTSFVVDTFSGTGSQTVFTGLTFAPAATASIAVFVAGVYQAPTSYSLSGTTLTFSSAPAAGTNNIRVLHLGTGATAGIPSSGSVTTDKIVDSAVTTAQIADSAVTTAKIAAGAVITVDIADANVTDAKIVSVANTKITGRMTASQLANTAVTPGTYGGSTQIPVITVDQQGRLTSAANTSLVAVSNGQLSLVSSSIGVIPDAPASASPYKILGQIAGVANTNSNVYVVPASTNTVVNLITICNGTQNNILIDLVARPSTEVLATKHFILKSLNIPAADTLVLDTGITLQTSAILSANVIGANATSSAAGVAIHAYGVEII